MFGPSSELLVRGIAAARDDDREHARFYLEWALRSDFDHEEKVEAWYWLSRVADDPAERRRCLEAALAARPSHPEARRDLAILDGRLKPEEIVDPERLAAPLAPPARLDADEVRCHRCPACGGALTAEGGRRALRCQFCGHRGDAVGGAAEEQDWTPAILTARGHRWEVPTERVFACEGCGASQVLPPGQASAACLFCGSSQVAQPDAGRGLVPPTGIAPFAVKRGAAGERAQRWLAARRLDPADPDSGVALDPPRPIYLPFWTFDIDGEIERRSHVREDQRREPRVERDPVHHDDVLVPASRSLPADLLAALRFDTGALAPYSSDLLAGWPAEIYRVPLAEASLGAREWVYRRYRAGLAPDGDLDDWTLSTAGLSVTSYKLALLPVWVETYRHRGRAYPLVVNGRSGETHGAEPPNAFRRFLRQVVAFAE